MKRLFNFIITLLVVIIAFSFIGFAMQEMLQPNYVATLIIDPGHGGEDVGMIGSDETYEKDLSLALAKKVGSKINECDPTIKVLYTREDDDVDASDEAKNLQARIDYGVKHKGDYFLSIHFNSYDDKDVYGYSAFMSEKDEISKELYDLIDYNFTEIKWSKGLYVHYVEETPLQVVSDNPIPSLLLEVGFMSNDKELKNCKDEKKQDEVADAIAQAYVAYIQANTKQGS